MSLDSKGNLAAHSEYVTAPTLPGLMVTRVETAAPPPSRNRRRAASLLASAGSRQVEMRDAPPLPGRSRAGCSSLIVALLYFIDWLPSYGALGAEAIEHQSPWERVLAQCRIERLPSEVHEGSAHCGKGRTVARSTIPFADPAKRDAVNSIGGRWGAWSMNRSLGLLLILLGVVANNVVYLQDLWLGQGHISLDSWRSYAGLLVSLVIILAGMVLLARSRATA
jgi:hypothetical protein